MRGLGRMRTLHRDGCERETMTDANAKSRRMRTRNRDDCEREPPCIWSRWPVPQLQPGVWSAAWAVPSGRHVNRHGGITPSAAHSLATASLGIAQTGERPTIAALLAPRIGCGLTNANNRTKQASRWSASVRLLLPTSQPNYLCNHPRARLDRPGLVAWLVAAPTAAACRRTALATVRGLL